MATIYHFAGPAALEFRDNIIYQFAGKVTQFSVKNKIHYRNLALKKDSQYSERKNNFSESIFNYSKSIDKYSKNNRQRYQLPSEAGIQQACAYRQINVYLQVCGRA